MTRSILWYQPEMLSDNDIVILNGEKLSIGNERDESFLQLNEIADKSIRHKSPWCGKVNGLFFIKGHLDATDEKGRLLPFMFVSNEENGHQALLRELKSIGYVMTKDTANCIKKQLSTSSIALIAIVIMIIILLLSICVKYGN